MPGEVEPRVVGVDPVGAIEEAWRIARSEYGFFLLLWLPALALQLAVDSAAVLYERSRAFGDPMTTGEEMELLGVGLPLYLLLLTVRVALWTFVAARVLDHVLGGKRLAGWRALVGPSLAAGFVLVLTYIAGALLLLVGLFVFVHWFVYVPAMLANGTRGLGAAFNASRRFARAHRTQGFTALVLLVGAVVYGGWFALDLIPGWTGIILSALVSWFFGPVVPLLAASYVALAWGRPSSEVSSASSSPRERETTKCPRCQALVPYTSSPNGVNVVCPRCRYAGRVL